MLCCVAVLSLTVRSIAQDTDTDSASEAAMAAYADAANFQTNGALDLAVSGWKKYLSKYPDHSMASSASHYLGVCYMQQTTPDYASAEKAFATALRDKEYDLREESLANRGWCLYASSGVYEDSDTTPEPDTKILREAISTFATMVKENRGSRFLDRAYFYSGEAAFDLGDARSAVAFYNKLLTLPNIKESPLRCDGLYSRGVAYEELGNVKDAISTYRQLMDQCANDELAQDAQFRLGDLYITQKDFDAAIDAFDQASKNADKDDQAYAVFRGAFALVQSGRSAEAALQYERIVTEFPESPYAATATLAAAQSAYRAGDMDAAARQFNEVIRRGEKESATEAAHWIARIEFAAGKFDKAAEVAKRQIDAGVGGQYEVALKLDLAEAYSMRPETAAKSLDMFAYVYRQHRDHPLASRALYNAAFSSLQASDFDRSLPYAEEFLKRFPDDTLAPDVLFIKAESLLLIGKAEPAITAYEELLAAAGSQNEQRSLWVVRTATALNTAKQYDKTIALLNGELETLRVPTQRAEALMILGQAQLVNGDSNQAAQSFESSGTASKDWGRADEALLMAGQANLAAGDNQAAKKIWQQLIRTRSGSRMSDQAHYKLAQLANNTDDHPTAIGHYNSILKSKNDPPLIPFAVFGKGWSLMQTADYAAAADVLKDLFRDYPEHSITRDALLTSGICKRNLDQSAAARSDLEKYLANKPSGNNLGHALYELALIDQQDKDPNSAATRLTQLVRDVPGYPSLDKVLYELGWSYRESGDDANALTYFTRLITEFPKNSLAAEAAYFVGQTHYDNGEWTDAAKFFSTASTGPGDDDLLEKSFYRLGWSNFKQNQLQEAETAFGEQAKRFPTGQLQLDALMMVGECRFKAGRYESAMDAFSIARKRILRNNDSAKTVIDAAERQVRELVLLHGGQSAAQLKQWDVAIKWYDELRNRFPSTDYLPHVFYELGFAYQQKNELKRALNLYSQVADNYRNEVAARARFMMGEIHFANKDMVKAIPEFQRVMFGFGADKASAPIKNWQAKSAFEAGRCAELLLADARTNDARTKSQKIAVDFYRHVVEKHPQHELASKARQRLGELK